MKLRLPRLQSTSPITDKDGRPAQSFQLWFQRFAEGIEGAFNGQSALIQQIADLTGVADQLGNLVADAQQAADDANAAAAAANAAAATAARDQALAASYIDPDTVLSTTPSLITVDPHTRIYGDGASVSVAGGTVATVGGATAVDYVFYDDPSRAGGLVSYQASVVAPTQTGDTHVVGAVTVPASGSSSGGSGPRPPGYVLP